ncbi:hypothetical protein, partial [Fulvivirga lutimaris]|uniref:hypothetical protein n=1 Tax=Fulvivirga lutimaris TaxID=1819566 RepID=UPI001C8896B5
DGFAFDDINITSGSGCSAVAINSFPYLEDFESGTLGSEWCVPFNSFSSVAVSSLNEPNNGSYHLTMETVPARNIGTNEALLFLDLSGQTNLEMEFYWKEFGDENDIDGIFLSDDGGSTFTRITFLNGENYTNNTWKKIIIDLDEIAAENALSFTNQFVVRFLHRDNFFIDLADLSTSDGFAFDDIVIRTPAPCLPTYSTLPFVDDFESGAFGSAWCIPNTSFARTEVSSENGPNTGSYHMVMDTDLTGTDARNEALLHLDLSAETD